MSTKLILAPAASGKTHQCIERVCSTSHVYPLSAVWVILPDSHQATAFRHRLAKQGGAMGARVGTFADLHGEILALVGTPMPVAPDSVVHRLALAAIDATADKGQLKHYASIRRQPGFALALTRLVAELKRARIEPASFQNAVKGHGQRLEELSQLYNEYQDYLIRLEWADIDGLGWLAVRVLQENVTIASHWKLLVVDGFDDLSPTQLETLRLLSDRVGETILTLTGDLAMQRNAYRRFERTLKRIQATLTPQIETLERCVTCVPVLAHLEKSLFESAPPKIKPDAALTFIEAQTQGLEAREALRWLKARIMREGIPLHECAIIARDIKPYHPFLRQASLEFGMPTWFASGDPLVTNPAIAAILNVLELAMGGWQRRPVIDALRTPYFDRTAFGLTPTDSNRFDQVARWGQVVKGLDQWGDAFTQLARQASTPEIEGEDDETKKPPTLPQGEQAQKLWDSLQGFARAVTPPEKATLIGFVGWLEDLLAPSHGLAVIEQAETQKDTTDRDRSALVAFKDILRALVLSEKIVREKSEMPYADFYTDLYGAVDAATYAPEDPRQHSQSRIYCSNLNQARGVSYRAVALLGLSEGLFPAPVDEDPFLPDVDREKLAWQALPVEPRLRSDQQSLFYEAVTRASDYLLLTRPYLADDGETWVASPFWTAVRGLYEVDAPLRARTESVQMLSDCASRVELLTAAVRRRGLPTMYADLVADWENLRYAGQILRARMARDYRGPLDGQLSALEPILTERFGPTYIWNASALETYAGCGFRFLIGNALALEELETPDAGYDVAQLGSLLHEILEKVYQQASDPTDADAVLQVLPRVAQEVFDAAPTEYGFRPLLIWDKQQTELLERLAETIRNLAEEEAGFRPTHFEKRFGTPPLNVETPAGSVLFRGIIDRVDFNAQGHLNVIDYKTGMSKLDNRSLGEGLRLQLALYALGAEKALKLGRVSDGFYWGILRGEASSLRLSKFKFTDPDGVEYSGMSDAIALTLKYIGADVEGIRAGHFVPIPPRGDCPNYCVAKSICWRYQPTEH
jgi:ATP-dependent helicase/nuclease subunit B